MKTFEVCVRYEAYGYKTYAAETKEEAAEMAQQDIEAGEFQVEGDWIIDSIDEKKTN